MPHGGRHGHTVRQLRRRIDEVLSEERKHREPTPPPISEEHAALRRRIAETCAQIELDYESLDGHGRPMCTPEGAKTALLALELMFAEAEYLEHHGVDWRPYQLDSFW